MNASSMITPATIKKIEETRFDQGEYARAMKFLYDELGALPTQSMTNFLARMYTACRTHDDVRQEIGENINVGPWVVSEVYIYLGMS